MLVGAALVLVLALTGGVASWLLLRGPQPVDTAVAYTEAWADQDYEAMGDLAAGESAELVAAHTEVAERLGVDAVQVDLGDVAYDPETDTRASAPVGVTLELDRAGAWSYDSELHLELSADTWQVDFTPATIHPDLSEGMTLARVNDWEERGHVLAADGTRIDSEQASGSLQLLSGSVGAADAEEAEELGPIYAEGDPVGLSGLQRTFQEELAGSPATSIRVVDVDAEDPTAADLAEDPEEFPEVEAFAGQPGTDVTTTIDVAVQQAAEQTIATAEEPSALVAVRPDTGEILASANAPAGYDRAVAGQYAPGSTFKVVSYAALLDAGMGMDATLDCPETATVGGWEFSNAGDAAYGEQSVTEAFATSCNTALLQEVEQRLDAEDQLAAAQQFGFNTELDIGVAATEPQFPDPDGAPRLIAESMGQGQLLTSPLHMATIPAAVSAGQWHAPRLVTAPEPTDVPEPRPIASAEELRSMMRAVITEGTAEDAGFGDGVFGKTGSAEYGEREDEDDELESHAWFVGFDEGHDIAFAVLVEGGGSGGGVAAPLGADFLAAL
ncbi:penicillin-binding transpeptidase domain-containing protein [Lipingzhangella rawalii]|uniref:penicillin-binding transpeptidase domain-containing protein n=1 Tax=Lipingzhangella rawalii TaxID=2055835 RepID=UPI00287BADB4|nr:penicillin-binding transpeptidase domain-containing protein [Lipingzhangella rawalii]